MDLLEDEGLAGLAALRCVQCGEVIDPVILKNRRPGQAGSVGAVKQSPAILRFDKRS
jgi:hypothetical protein